MYKYLFALALAGLVTNPAVADHTATVRLPRAVFEDAGDIVHIIGLKVGSAAEESSVPGMKTSVELWCNSKDCDSNQVTVWVPDDVVIVYPPLAHRYAIKVWETVPHPGGIRLLMRRP